MKNLRIVLIVGAVLILNPVTLVIGWFGMMKWENANPEKGQNFSQVDWLPKAASDVSFYRSYSWKAWEFSISESDFLREWKSRYHLKEITEPRVISRFSRWEFRTGDPPKDGLAFFREQQKHTARITDGLYAAERWDNGGGYHLVFDRDNERAYFESNPR